MVRCSQCGTQNPKEADYCQNCGVELNTVSGKDADSSGGFTVEYGKTEGEGKQKGTQIWGSEKDDTEMKGSKGDGMIDSLVGSMKGAFDSIRPSDPFKEGRRALESEEYEKAVEKFDEVLSSKPEDSNVWYNKGKAYQHLGEFDKAMDCYDKATSKYPDHGKAWTNKGVIYLKKGDIEAAIDSLEKATKIDPPDRSIGWDDRGFATAWFNKGEAYEEKGEIRKAKNCFEKVLSIDPPIDDMKSDCRSKISDLKNRIS